MSYLICSYLGKREVHINTDYATTGWMLCVIPHINNDIIDNPDGNNRKQANNIIKTYWLSDYELHVTLNLFWGEYTEFNQK